MKKQLNGEINESGCTVNSLLEKGEEQVAEAQEETEREIERRICDDYAKTVWTMYNSFINTGFSKRQAFELVLMMVSDHGA